MLQIYVCQSCVWLRILVLVGTITGPDGPTSCDKIPSFGHHNSWKSPGHKHNWILKIPGVLKKNTLVVCDLTCTQHHRPVHLLLCKVAKKRIM